MVSLKMYVSYFVKFLVSLGSGYRESGEGVDFGVNDLLLTADSSVVVLSEPSSVTDRGYCTRLRSLPTRF